MSPVTRFLKLTLVAALAAVLVASDGVPTTTADATTIKHYLVVFSGSYDANGAFQLGGSWALNHQTALSLVTSAGGTVTNDLSRQIGVVSVASPNAAFATVLRASPLVESVGEDYKWKALPSWDEVRAAGAVTMSSPPPNAGPDPVPDPLEALQWDMVQIRVPQAHAIQAGWRAVDVGVLDSGIDGRHPDFLDANGVSNVDCDRGRNSITFMPDGPGVGTPDVCSDNQFHGTHVAGTIGAQANGIGIVGVAPGVTLIPVKVCDTSGYCYASAVVDGITYAGDQKFDVINMSFFVDDNEFQQSTEYKCMDDPVQRTFRRAVERAIQYARNQGVTPVAALGNSDDNLADPPEPYNNNCDVVPAETMGVVGTMSLGRQSEKARYSNYGVFATDVAAPGGNGTTGVCDKTILSTIPGGGYLCIQGTSMASPHAAGVAALIVSQFGRMGSDGDVKMNPQQVESYLQSTTVDIGLPGYDMCFGNGRIDALRAVTHDTSRAYDASAPFCAEYNE